jgi:hypothetical protein
LERRKPDEQLLEFAVVLVPKLSIKQSVVDQQVGTWTLKSFASIVSRFGAYQEAEKCIIGPIHYVF